MVSTSQSRSHLSIINDFFKSTDKQKNKQEVNLVKKPFYAHNKKINSFFSGLLHLVPNAIVLLFDNLLYLTQEVEEESSHFIMMYLGFFPLFLGLTIF